MKYRVDVVGGVYRELCRLPSGSDEIWVAEAEPQQ